MEMISKNFKNIRDDLVNIIEPNIFYCYQCGKCSAGCPLNGIYEYQPNQIIRLIQIDKIDLIFDANSIYLCLACEICSSRCPQEVNIAAIMNYLRIKSWEQDSFKVKALRNFYRSFLKIIQLFGRSYEPALILSLNLMSGKIFNDFDIALDILKKKKIKLIPEIVKDRKPIAEIIKKHL